MKPIDVQTTCNTINSFHRNRVKQNRLEAMRELEDERQQKLFVVDGNRGWHRITFSSMITNALNRGRMVEKGLAVFHRNVASFYRRISVAGSRVSYPWWF